MNQITIPKEEFTRLKKEFGWFNTYIDEGFSNADEVFDKDGNFILRKNMLPEEIVHYDKNNGDKKYVFKRNNVWKLIPKTINDYHIPNKILADALANVLIFRTPNNSLYNPTVPEQNILPKSNNVFNAGPSKAQLKKERRAQSKINNFRREIGEEYNNNVNSYKYNGKPPSGSVLTNKELVKLMKEEKKYDNKIEKILEAREEKKEKVEEVVEKLQNIYKKKQNIAKALYHIQKAEANRTKYGRKPGTLPGTKKQIRIEKTKGKRRTQNLNKARRNKTVKRVYNNNNENNNY
jgi:hypothetical protein